MAEIWKLRGDPTQEQIEAAAAILRRGGLAILPTDTIYGVHAVAEDEPAVRRIVALKGRDENKPLVALCSSIEQAVALGVQIDSRTATALMGIWPAELTAVVALKAPIAASAGAATLGVRIPPLKWLRALLQRSGPLASTSVNRSGEPALTDAANIPPAIRDTVDLILDGGPIEGQASTVVDFTRPVPVVLREGKFGFTQKLWKTLWK